MNMMSKIRLYHCTLASLAILAYLTGELGVVHAWLGYGVALIIALRLLWALFGSRQVGLMRFYPSFEGLRADNMFTHPAISKVLMLGIAVSLVAVVSTGVAMDRGKTIGMASASIATTSFADDVKRRHREGNREGKKGGMLSEAHEFLANMLLLFVGMHVTYLVLFKRPLAKFMVFVPMQTRKD
jgi:cytochrome b